MKKYRSGMYGGKFYPMHKGHLHCVEKASKLCDTLYLLLFIGGEQEDEIAKADDRDFLSVKFRTEQIIRVSRMFDNVLPAIIDVSSCRDDYGKEDWGKETPLVLDTCGKFDAVFGSEPDYAQYFKRAYPWAEYVLIDIDRKEVPISATKIRALKNSEEVLQWIV